MTYMYIWSSADITRHSLNANRQRIVSREDRPSIGTSNHVDSTDRYQRPTGKNRRTTPMTHMILLAFGSEVRRSNRRQNSEPSLFLYDLRLAT